MGACFSAPTRILLSITFLLIFLTTQVFSQTINIEITENTVPFDDVIYDLNIQEGQMIFVSQVGGADPAVVNEYFEYSEGIIRAKKTVDRDDIAARTSSTIPFLPLTITFSYLHSGGSTNVHVRILDENDIEPSFPSPVQNVEIREGSVGSRDVTIQKANDDDEGSNSVRNYELVDNLDGLFGLFVREDEGTGEIIEVRLESHRELDREQRSQYTLQMIASEGTNNPRSVTRTLNVTVGDVCDTRPVFPTTRYLPPSIPENSPNGTVIFNNITAYDADLVDADGLNYRISEVCRRPEIDTPCESVTDGQHPFELDTETGFLVLEGEIDREEYAQYEVSIHASDQCSMSDSATVVVVVDDVNDNCPNITFAPSVFGGKIKETNVNLPITVGFFTVSDLDSGNNGNFNVELFELVNGERVPSNTFQLDTESVTLELDLIQRVDREERSEYTIILVATDFGSPPCERNLTETLIVEDFNDNSPIIQRGDLSANYNIPEESVQGYFITTIQATDEDDPATGNGLVTYHLPSSDENFPYQHLFEVEETTGILKVGGRVDREAQANLRVLVLAEDNPEIDSNTGRRDPVNNDSVIINITLTDINDNPPVIHYPPSTLQFREDFQVNNLLFQINATDRDSPELTSLKYEITPSNSPFLVNEDSGAVFVQEELDFEVIQEYNLTLTVRDGEADNDDTMITQQPLTISVQNVNDVIPVFGLSSTRIVRNILEDVQPPVHVTTINATDEDTLPQDIRFEIESGNEMGHFYIDAITGRITTTVKLDKESVTNYTLTLTANDGEFYTEDFASVVVKVLDINDNPPVFIGDPYSFQVQEEVQGGTTVQGPDGETIQADDLDTGSNSEIRFKIIGSTPSAAMDWFSIDPELGTITTNMPLDRESSVLGASGIVSLSVEAENPPDSDSTSGEGLSNIAIVDILIIDINDQSPTFEEDSITISLSENHGIGNPFLTVEAIDRDQPPHNEIEYTILNSPPGIEDRILIDPMSGELSLREPLNHEDEALVQFRVQAKDTDERHRLDEQTIIINVTDAKDPCLRFVDFNPTMTLEENSPPDTTVLVFEATNLEGESVVTVEYDLSNLDGTSSNEFAIIVNSDLQARLHTTSFNIDREALVSDSNPQAVYQLNITAHDTVSFQECVTITSVLTVTITDVNDNPPRFSQDEYNFTITENMPSGTPAGSVLATDRDEGLNSEVSYSIEGSVPFEITQEGQIRSTDRLDHDPPGGTPQYTFSVTARDNGEDPMSSQVLVTVDVQDVNDNDPVFDRNQNRTFEVPENAEIGTMVARILVSDSDSGVNGEVTITINQGSRLDPNFQLQSDGTILLIDTLNREEQATYTFEVRAQDGGERSDSAMVTILVGDVNDNAPVFGPEPIQTIHIPENQEPLVPFTQVTAEDADSGMNAQIKFRLADNTLSKTFCINSMSGEIFVCLRSEPCEPPGIQTVDFERQSSYDVTIVAYDEGFPRLFAFKTIYIEIENVNEHIPEFDASSVVVVVDEGIDPGTEVLRIQAYDWDFDSLTYSVMENGQVSVNFRYENGAIVSSSPIDFNRQDRYYLSLVAQELNTEERHYQTIMVTVYVRNINDHRPVFDTALYPTSTQIPENTPIEMLVLTVHADDPDNATHDAVTYEITNGNIGNAFAIDSLTGDVTVQSQLDHDSIESYSLTIVAKDTGDPQMTSTSLPLTITILNINDELPIFTEESYQFSYIENMPIGTSVGKVIAEDRDKDPFGDVRYSLPEGDHEFFEVDPTTGDVRSLQVIDREDETQSFSVTFQVRATDSGITPETATVQVTVTVADINDNAPQFDNYPIYFHETATLQPGEVVGNLADFVTDLDTGENADVMFEIVTQISGNQLRVSPSGDVTLASAPEPTAQIYSAQVRVYNTIDSLASSLLNTAFVGVVISRENDRHPRFENFEGFSVSVREDEEIGFVVFNTSLYATDPDSSPNGDLTFQFQESYSEFSIEPTHGLITLRTQLDFEGQRDYTLRVAAMDGNGRTTETYLQVTVTSVNDNKPIFESSTVPEKLTFSPIPRADVNLFTVEARDADQGGQDGMVGYFLLEDGDTSPSFSVDAEHGIVRSKGLLTAGNTYNLTVTAYDGGQPQEQTDAVILVVIEEPETSETPQFTGITPPHQLNVDEGRPIGFSLHHYITNPEAGAFKLVYTDAPSSLFSVSRSQGILQLEGNLVYTEVSYNLLIEAYIEDTTDLNDVQRSSSFLEVVVNVQDVNDHNPTFLIPIVTVPISEDADVGTLVFTAEAFDGDFGDFATLNYEISSGNVDRVFEINRTSGEVRLGDTLNREEYASYDLTIRAFDSIDQPIHRNFGEMHLIVEVTDVNDYAPHFLQEGNYSIGVYEFPHTQGGAGIIRISAQDLDVGVLQLRYELFFIEEKRMGQAVSSTPQNPFEINLDTGMISLRSNAQLDYESVDYYLLRIEASDGIETAVTYLKVNVLNVNDHSPEITFDGTTPIKAWEQQLINTQVAKITSSDGDSDLSGVVTYSLGPEWPEPFSIDPHTGVIRVTSTLVATLELSTFQATVYVTDEGTPAMTDSQMVTVHVFDVNDHAPDFDSESYIFAISIASSADDLVGTFNVTDQDYRENSAVYLMIPRYYSEANQLFSLPDAEPSIESGLTRLTLKTTHDLEAKNYTFQLEALNPSFCPTCAPYQQHAYANVTVVVYPECPTFTQTMYSVEITEEEFSPNALRQLSATSSVDREVEYFFNDGMERPFSIGRTTGILTLSQALDREVQDVYEFSVAATDSVLQPLTCSATVRVTVIDINDNEPEFTSEEYQFSVMENRDPEVSVGQVSAIDLDVGQNHLVHYELSELATVPFRVDHESGIVYTTIQFDAEDIETYTFEVIAIDSGEQPLTGSVQVTVTITDVNEYVPVLQPEYTFDPIGPGIPIGAVVGEITAEDLDKRAQLVYAFVNEEPKQYFEIGRTTGIITLIVDASGSNAVKRSIEKRQLETSSEYFPVEAMVLVSDGTNNVTTTAEFSLHNSFRTEPVPADSTLIIIIVVVASVVAVIVVFVIIVVIACVCRYRRRSKKVQIKDSIPPNNIELDRFSSRRSQGSRSSTPGQHRINTTRMYPEHTTLHHSSGSGSNSSRQSYSNYADDELDITHDEIRSRSAYNSPGLSKKPSNNASHARSTSDLASSIGTDMLGSQQLPHPKAKIAAIYAAHHGLLNNHGSSESIHSNHTFASEGGGEADAEEDINNMLYNKYEFEDDDDDDVTTLPDDSSYIGKDTQLTDSGGNLTVPPVEEDLPHYPYSSQPMGDWAPRAQPMEHAINELSELASYSSSQEHHLVPVPRYTEHSQPVSMYGASSQGSRISLLRQHPHRHYADLPPQMGPPLPHEYDYYQPQEPRQTRHHSQPRYGSATALSHSHDFGMVPPREILPPHRGDPRVGHRYQPPRGPPMMLSQDVPPTYLQQGHHYPLRGVIQTPSSDTPTDGTVTPHQAMGQEYNHTEYMSSSSTSLGSTNLSGTTSSIGNSQRIYHGNK